MEITTLQGQEGIDAIKQAKENYRSRNHYGRTYTLLKMENHQQNVEIARLKELLEKEINESEDWKEKCSKVAIVAYLVAYLVGALVGGMVAISIQGGL